MRYLLVSKRTLLGAWETMEAPNFILYFAVFILSHSAIDLAPNIIPFGAKSTGKGLKGTIKNVY